MVADSGPTSAPETTMTLVPGETGTAVIIKGPPRQAQTSLRGRTLLICVVVALGAVAALVFASGKRRGYHGHRTRGATELDMPGDFRMKDSAIGPESPPLGIFLERKPDKEKWTRRVSDSVGPAVLIVANAVRVASAKGKVVMNRVLAARQPARAPGQVQWVVEQVQPAVESKLEVSTPVAENVPAIHTPVPSTLPLIEPTGKEPDPVSADKEPPGAASPNPNLAKANNVVK